jgi:hypothetical protein
LQGLIGAVEVQIAVSTAEGEGPRSYEELDSAVPPMIKQIPDEVQSILLLLLRELGKEAHTSLEIDGPSVIGINQSEVPKL